MKMTKEEFKEKLREEASKQSIIMSEDILEKLYKYKEILVEWSGKINLTTIIDDYDVIIKHLVDSLIVTKYIKEGQCVIDIGTGAGLPGIVISIYFEGSVKVLLMDSVNKKITFLEEVIKSLNLSNIKTLQARAEEACHKVKYREIYDIAIARAVAGLNILSEYLSGYVRQDGKCIFMKAGNIQEEVQQAQDAFNKTQIFIEKEDKYKIEYLEEQLSRTIIIAKKTGKLESIYPRNYGSIKKSPL